MRARWFLMIGIAAGGLGAVAWILARNRPAAPAAASSVVGTELFRAAIRVQDADACVRALFGPESAQRLYKLFKKLGAGF